MSAAGRLASLESRRLWSLWDMLELKAASFYGVTSALHMLGHKIKDGKLKSTEEAPDGGLLITFENDPVLVRQMKEDTEELRDNLRILGARLTLVSANKMLTAVLANHGFTWEIIGQHWEEIYYRLLDELNLVKVFVTEERRADYFSPVTPLFGDDFALKFQTDGAFELDEAAKCLALSRPTAAVFHLMRIMEIGIRAITRCLQISDPIKPAERNWGVILKAVRDGIDVRWPSQAVRMSGDGQVFDNLYATLDAVKHPWRNATMHVEKKYTDDEAEHIFGAIRGFMKALASRCDENGEPKA